MVYVTGVNLLYFNWWYIILEVMGASLNYGILHGPDWQFIATNSNVRAVLPWFRVHIVILNDPGRLISGFVAGWSGVMLSYELLLWYPTDPVYNPIWRQGIYVMCLKIIFIGLMKLLVCFIFYYLALVY